MKVLIYSLTDVFYYSFYIEGFYRVFGQENVKFSCEEFPHFVERKLAVILMENNTEKRIIVDALDSTKISGKLLRWCEVYGKVNYNHSQIPSEGREKIIPIGPSFGIKLWSLPETLKFAVSNYFLSQNRNFFKKSFFTNYIRQYKRLPIRHYELATLPDKNFIFFLSSLWEKEISTNFSRSIFIRACKELESVRFEGGFAPRSDGNHMEFFDLVDKRIQPEEYNQKLRRSFVVFNTPAVNRCHGWKLGEFLAAGKAIISTAHENTLPEPLNHGIHIHYVEEDKEMMKIAIENIRKDLEYRQLLEQNAKNYYKKNLAPEVVVKKLKGHPINNKLNTA